MGVSKMKIRWTTRIGLAGVALIAGAAVATGASAATMLTADGTPLTLHLHNGPAEPDSTDLVSDTKPGGFLVDVLSTSLLHNAGNSGGFAQIDGIGGGPGDGFVDLTIDPRDPITGMDAIKFKIELDPKLEYSGPTIPNGYKTDFTFDTRVFFVGGGFHDFLATPWTDPGRYVITAALGESIEKIALSNLVGTSTKKGKPTLTGLYDFSDIKQVSFDGTGVTVPVPEPVSWALMICGFGMVGAMLRRRRAAAA
jgi:hypothetical protein